MASGHGLTCGSHRYFTWAGHLSRREHPIQCLMGHRSMRWQRSVAFLAGLMGVRAWTGHPRR
eukprot:13123005-Alexandrium_andersonii.AAC.1